MSSKGHTPANPLSTTLFVFADDTADDCVSPVIASNVRFLRGRRHRISVAVRAGRDLPSVQSLSSSRTADASPTTSTLVPKRCYASGDLPAQFSATYLLRQHRAPRPPISLLPGASTASIPLGRVLALVDGSSDASPNSSGGSNVRPSSSLFILPLSAPVRRSMNRRGSSPSPCSSSAPQLPQIRTDTDTSSVNNASGDLPTTSPSLTTTRTTIPSTKHTVVQSAASPGSSVHHRLAADSGAVASNQQQQQQTSKKLHSPHAMSSTNFAVSATSISFSSMDDTANPRRRDNNKSIGGGGGRGSLQSPLQRRHSGDNSVMDAVSRSLNAHNDPELEGLPPMGDESSADGSTLLYEKGFLISASAGADRETGVSNTPAREYPDRHLHDEGQPQSQQQQQRENSVSGASPSRGPPTSMSGISHRLLTAEEIEERRRVTSRTVSQAASHALPGASDTNRDAQANSSLSLSAGGKPAHRQLSKEETEKLIAQRQQQFKEQEKLKQQQRAAAAAAATMTTTTHSTPPADATIAATSVHRQPNAPPPVDPSSRPSHTHTGVPGPAPLNSNAAPWLMSGDGTQSALLHGESGPPSGAAGGGAVTFEWLHGANTGGGGGVVGTSERSWPGANQWRDNTSGPAAVTVGAMNAAFPGAGDGGGLAIPAVGATGLYTWLPNTSYWLSLEQQQQQQQQQQEQQHPPPSMLMPAVTALTGAPPHDAFSFMSGVAPTSGLQLTGPLSGLTLSLLQTLTVAQLETGIRQCDEHVLRVQQDREILYHELQRRQYTMAGSNVNHMHSTSTSIVAGAGGAGPVGATAEALGWPVAMDPATATASTTNVVHSVAGGSGPASTGSPSRFFTGPGVEGLPHMLDVRTAVPHIAPGMNFSTVASAGTSSMATNATTSERRHSESDGPAVAASTAAVPTVPLTAKTIRTTAPTGSEGWRRAREHLSTNGSNNNNDRHRQHYNSNNNNSSTGSRGQRRGQRPREHSRVADTVQHGGRGGAHNASPSFGAATSSASAGAPAASGNRCSHDNTPQEQKYLQTDPFSMYEHNKKIATTTPSTKPTSAAGGAGAGEAAQSSKHATV
ncbi:hypothetical protein ABB37_08825 [Leptomonas pyrrhocoris]|uniref:Uncharacterized protein n=1 Tax=Leptomonas pyrrhocoris TaxID=157538 RepID=A0A0M9FSJ5_LEPPY|nr:hypothetical protein ABB37_08825 [Leptomonas pyrrhocoris]KPA75163.1 hypothetical protein ABB37_08825 [Leptomonas pyrrhocoris]|eukprot:XP_015653602.1 hypothetical protein ABB37_08825 [Leptomonas pyrrhocoris]